jgi:CheY-like chemotaxis protein
MDKAVQILLVEDDPLDVIEFKRTIDKMQFNYNLDVAANGEEAIEILKKKQTKKKPLPDVLLIDINMPRMNGIELLSVIRSTEEWKKLKCFILTTSADKMDRQIALKFGISGYIVKPIRISNPTSIDSFNLMIDLINVRG